MHTNDTQTESTSRDPRALNAYRHGLTGQVHVVAEIDQIAYDKLCRATQEYFNPVGDFEVSMVQSVADDRWQLQRASTIEDFIFACDMGGTDPLVEDPIKNYALVRGQTWLSSGKELERIALYAQRIQRRLEKNLAMLRQLQADRKAALEKAVGKRRPSPNWLKRQAKATIRGRNFRASSCPPILIFQLLKSPA